jgi:hypothetical protein
MYSLTNEENLRAPDDVPENTMTDYMSHAPDLAARWLGMSTITRGTRITVEGLTSAAGVTHNGKAGVALRLQGERWQLRLDDGSEMALRVANLVADDASDVTAILERLATLDVQDECESATEVFANEVVVERIMEAFAPPVTKELPAIVIAAASSAMDSLQKARLVCRVWRQACARPLLVAALVRGALATADIA